MHLFALHDFPVKSTSVLLICRIKLVAGAFESSFWYPDCLQALCTMVSLIVDLILLRPRRLPCPSEANPKAHPTLSPPV